MKTKSIYRKLLTSAARRKHDNIGNKPLLANHLLYWRRSFLSSFQLDCPYGMLLNINEDLEQSLMKTRVDSYPNDMLINSSEVLEQSDTRL